MTDDVFAHLSAQYEDFDQAASFSQIDEVLDVALITNKGGREENQDAWLFLQAQDGSYVFCVADGLGGHEGGRKASQVATQALADYVQSDQFRFENPQTLVEAFQVANTALLNFQQHNPELASMRTTLIILMIKDALAFWGHVGDVRLYRLRQNQIQFQTRDQSVPQMLVDMEEIEASEIRNHPERNRLLNALGSEKKNLRMAMCKTYVQLRQGDSFHLSSDGFWEWILENQLEELFSEKRNMQQTTEKMQTIVQAKAQQTEPENDNYTAINIRILSASINQKQRHKTVFFNPNS